MEEENLKVIASTINNIKNKTDVQQSTINNIIQRLDFLEQNTSNINISNIVEKHLSNRKEVLTKKINTYKNTKIQIEKLQNERTDLELSLTAELSDIIKSLVQNRINNINDALLKVDEDIIDSELSKAQKSIEEYNI